MGSNFKIYFSSHIPHLAFLWSIFLSLFFSVSHLISLNILLLPLFHSKFHILNDSVVLFVSHLTSIDLKYSRLCIPWSSEFWIYMTEIHVSQKVYARRSRRHRGLRFRKSVIEIHFAMSRMYPPLFLLSIIL